MLLSIVQISNSIIHYYFSRDQALGSINQILNSKSNRSQAYKALTVRLWLIRSLSKVWNKNMTYSPSATPSVAPVSIVLCKMLSERLELRLSLASSRTSNLQAFTPSCTNTRSRKMRRCSPSCDRCHTSKALQEIRRCAWPASSRKRNHVLIKS